MAWCQISRTRSMLGCGVFAASGLNNQSNQSLKTSSMAVNALFKTLGWDSKVTRKSAGFGKLKLDPGTTKRCFFSSKVSAKAWSSKGKGAWVSDVENQNLMSEFLDLTRAFGQCPPYLIRDRIDSAGGLDGPFHRFMIRQAKCCWAGVMACGCDQTNVNNCEPLR